MGTRIVIGEGVSAIRFDQSPPAYLSHAGDPYERRLSRICYRDGWNDAMLQHIARRLAKDTCG